MSGPDTQPTPQTDALALLEFPLVLERLAAFTTLAQSRLAALALEPSSDLPQIKQRQQETEESRRFVDGDGYLETSGVQDIAPSVQRASLDGALQGTELRAVHDTLKACRNLRDLLARRQDLPLLSSRAKAMPRLQELEKEIASKIDLKGLLTSNASPALRNLRSQAQDAHAELNQSLERTLRRLQRDNLLQEPLVTERNGRLVLMVKTEMRSRVPGIVHDVSDSGATAFIEPLQAVPLGNQWRESSLAARREEERVLREMSTRVGFFSGDILQALDALAGLDLAVAKGRYSMALKATSPIFVEAQGAFLSLTGARHPLLQGDVVPIDISIGGQTLVLLITGPNAGGKTVTLKTAGLISAMAQSGLHVPARQCTLTTLDAIYTAIGDQQSIERSLSSFSSHLQTLAHIMKRATPHSLVLLDELGASTDPEEGAALAKALLSYFARKGIPCVATTHHRDVAAYAQDQPGMVNASVELDPNTLTPTFHLALGLPGRSYALTIAARMGLDTDTLEQAHALLSVEHRHAEELLQQLEQERYLAQVKRQESQEELARTQDLRLDLEAQREALEVNKAQILEETRQQLQAQADDLWKRLRGAERALLAPPNIPQVKTHREQVEQVRKEIRSSLWQPAEASVSQWVKELQAGDYVYLQGIPQPMEVISPLSKANTVEVLLGSIRAHLPSHQLERKAEGHAPRLPAGVSLTQTRPGPMPSELDLRGLRFDEAQVQLDEFLDRAVLRGLATVRVIHGGGTGALRSLVREGLKGHPIVKDLRSGDPSLTDGVTIVEFN
jgi:DNA mismatch repair protein MutS2